MLTALILTGCVDEENIPNEVFFDVTDKELIYKGEIADKFAFGVLSENDTVRCTVRTVFIMENDSLESIKVSTIDDQLYIRIETSPYNNPEWEWYDIENLTKVHEVRFNILGLKKGTYNLLGLRINNIYLNKDNFIIN
ncbi:hypothetical protein SDC9_157414 [bioreactor metagenome]|uniref:Uncharacterized protein n=1 Tax=bioreactor metagenome TaxID=1076179 RepID=A0A645F763_9ZZZZ